MAQLPRTCNTKHDQLHNRPPYNPSIRRLALITELGLALTLEHLLPAHILQPACQVLDLLDNVIDLALVRAFNLARLADGQIQRQLDVAQVLVRSILAAMMVGPVGREADAVLARLGRREGEFALLGAALGDDGVVVVEDFGHGDEQLEVV